jgi:hypothetical protein
MTFLGHNQAFTYSNPLPSMRVTFLKSTAIGKAKALLEVGLGKLQPLLKIIKTQVASSFTNTKIHYVELESNAFQVTY